MWLYRGRLAGQVTPGGPLDGRRGLAKWSAGNMFGVPG
jgi:hypothetical protein